MTWCLPAGRTVRVVMGLCRVNLVRRVLGLIRLRCVLYVVWTIGLAFGNRRLLSIVRMQSYDLFMSRVMCF